MKIYTSQLYPFTDYSETHRRNLFFSLFVAVFLLMFRPFGLNVYSYEQSYIIMGYGLVLFLSLSLNDFLAYRFLPKVFCEKNWTIGTQISWTFIQLFVAGFACFIYAVAIDAFPKSLTSFLKIELYVLLSSIIPIVLIVLIKQNYLLRQNTRQAVVLNAELQAPDKRDAAQKAMERVVFLGDNQHERLEINPDHIYYVTSQDNYIEVAWQEGDGMSKKLIRGTLTKAEEASKSFPNIFRCHRAFIVNLNRVVKIEGNAQGYRLFLRNCPDVIPVSRSKGQQLHQRLQGIR